MKKLLLLILLIPMNIHAFENNVFSININDYYSEENIVDNIYTWTNTSNSSDTISVIVNDNNENINISKFNKKDINKYKEDIISALNINIDGNEISPNISNIRKEKINDYVSVSFDNYYNTSDYYGYNITQRYYTFTSKNYIITIVYTNNNESIESFSINDDGINDYYDYIVICVSCLIILLCLVLKKK